MRRGVLLRSLLLVIVMMVLVSACGSDTPTSGPITIELEPDFNTRPVAGPFTVTEGADILGCSSGTAVDTFNEATAEVTHLMTCSGPKTGTFTIMFSAAEDKAELGEPLTPWRILDGFDDFAGLQGEGGSWHTHVDGPETESVHTYTGDIEYTDDTSNTSTTAASATTATAAPPTVGGGDLGGGEPFADGTYTMGQLGVPVTFTVTGEWSTQPVGPGFFVITTPDSRGPGDHDIVAMAPTQLFDAATGEPLPADDDLAGWLDSVPATATISEVTVGEIDGFETTVFTVDVGEVDLPFVDVDGEFGKRFESGFIFEVHWVDHPDGPITFVIGTPIDDLAWLDTARGVVETIELG